MSTAQLECLLNYINSLNLSLRSRRWLSDKLIEPVAKSEAQRKKEEVLAGIDAGLKDLKAGRSVDAWNFLEELKNED